MRNNDVIEQQEVFHTAFSVLYVLATTPPRNFRIRREGGLPLCEARRQ